MENENKNIIGGCTVQTIWNTYWDIIQLPLQCILYWEIVVEPIYIDTESVYSNLLVVSPSICQSDSFTNVSFKLHVIKQECHSATKLILCINKGS